MINVSRICCSCTTLNKILLLEQIYTYLLLPLLLWSIKHMCRYLLIFVWTPKGLQSSLWLYYANENIALLINIVAWVASCFSSLMFVWTENNAARQHDWLKDIYVRMRESRCFPLNNEDKKADISVSVTFTLLEGKQELLTAKHSLCESSGDM